MHSARTRKHACNRSSPPTITATSPILLRARATSANAASAIAGTFVKCEFLHMSINHSFPHIFSPSPRLACCLAQGITRSGRKGSGDYGFGSGPSSPEPGSPNGEEPPTMAVFDTPVARAGPPRQDTPNHTEQQRQQELERAKKQEVGVVYGFGGGDEFVGEEWDLEA
jgi:hypothetical protein